MTARPTAQASGFPPKVLPCVPAVRTPRTSCGATTADTGTIPPPRALPRTSASGRTPSRCTANVVPTRPRPAWISSAMNSAPWESQTRRTAARYPGGGTMTPASPWIGSSSTATVLASTAAVRASASP